MFRGRAHQGTEGSRWNECTEERAYRKQDEQNKTAADILSTETGWGLRVPDILNRRAGVLRNDFWGCFILSDPSPSFPFTSSFVRRFAPPSPDDDGDLALYPLMTPVDGYLINPNLGSCMYSNM